jgi:group II intron reverse transcriptase/maturase
MNLYNPTAGFEVPNMRGVVDYIVSTTLKRTKQPAERIGIVGENPKVYKRRSLIEFGIARNTEVSGRRRIHSTKYVFGKGSSLFTSKLPMLAGIDYVEELEILKSRLDKGEKANNLSRIMSDPNFLIACWVRIRSKKGNTIQAFEETIDGIKMEWFKDAAAVMRKGSYNFAPVRRTYVLKTNKKLRSLIIASPKDQIVQEGIRFLLELIYEPLFLDCSYAWRPGRGCHDALTKIRMQCKTVGWYIKGNIEQQFLTIDHHILVSLIQEKVHDQAFIDLIFKYIRIGFEETSNSASFMKTGLIQDGILSPILANIYMHLFDEWIMNDLKVQFDTVLKRQKNEKCWRQYARAGRKTMNKPLKSTVVNDLNWKQLWYYRYADDFIIGINGSNQDAIRLKNEIQKYLDDRLKQTLTDDKTLITHAETTSADFLGYRIRRTPLSKILVKRDKLGKKTGIVPRLILDAPIKAIVKNLIDEGYVKPNLQPTRNSRLINLKLFQIIEHYNTVEKSISNYYFLANNYGKLLGQVHFLLKYSCVLTIASKMRLKTMKEVFRKYGKNLSVKSGKGVVTYPTPSYKKPSQSPTIMSFDNNFIEKIHARLPRGRNDPAGPCYACGSLENIEVLYHVRALRKYDSTASPDFLTKQMSKINRKQIVLCDKCHKEIYANTHDGPTLR